MKWTNLKQNKCPKCNCNFMTMGNATFKEDPKYPEHQVIHCKCGFSITEKKMTKIVNSLVNNVLSMEMVG